MFRPLGVETCNLLLLINIDMFGVLFILFSASVFSNLTLIIIYTILNNFYHLSMGLHS
jgi:hypothetical protein